MLVLELGERVGFVQPVGGAKERRTERVMRRTRERFEQLARSLLADELERVIVAAALAKRSAKALERARDARKLPIDAERVLEHAETLAILETVAEQDAELEPRREARAERSLLEQEQVEPRHGAELEAR